MNKKGKLLIISFVITALYFAGSWAYFINAPLEEHFYDFFIMIPSIVIFLFGFTEGDFEAFIAGIILFLIIWFVLFVILRALVYARKED